MRRLTTALASTALVASATMTGAATATAVPERAASTASEAAKPKVSATCKKALKKRTKAIKGKTFGTCMVRAMTTSKTFRVRTTTPGFLDTTTYRYGSTIDFDSRSEGVRLVAVGKDTWLQTGPGGDWIVADANGDEEQRGLASIVKETRRQMTAKTQARPYAKGSAWKHTGKVKTIKGVKAWEYAGSTKGTYTDGVKVLKERVWLDRNFRQVKATTKLSSEGVTFTLTQVITGYGKKVDLAAGTPRG